MTNDETLDPKLELARELVKRLEQGEHTSADTVLAELTGFGDSVLFQEVGRLTRNIHESIKSFVLDADMEQLVTTAVPDAAQRLRYVIETTEQAANTTMDAVEASLPLTESLGSDAVRLAAQWDKFNSRELSVEDFKLLSKDLREFLKSTEDNSKALHDKLSEVLMAQGFQDLTGQIIRKVIVLVQDVEGKLVELVALSGQKQEEEEQSDQTKVKEIDGPVVPGVQHGDTVNGQDEVDDLLSSLGF